MEMEITYADGSLPLSIPDERFMGILAAPTPDTPADPDVIDRAVTGPLDKEPLASFASSGDPVLVLVNDGTRPTPTAEIITYLWQTIGDWDLSFLVATGTHEPPSEVDCERIFGSRWDEIRAQTHFHDATDQDALEFVGTTKAGTRVSLNSKAVAAGKILVLSSVEAHYFAGYTGGRKILLPGISAWESIEQNHRLAMEPGAQALRLEGNPVNEDMDQVIDMLPDCDIFAVLAVLDREHQIRHVAAGDMRRAFLSAATVVDGMVSAELDTKAEIVVAVAEPPLDCNLYQAQKAIEHGRLALKEGGILLLVSGCAQGIGSTAFLNIMEQKGSPTRVMEDRVSEYRLGYHKAARLARVAQESELWALTGVDDEVVTAAFMQPRSDLQSAVDDALKSRPGGKVWLLTDAGATVPRLTG